MNDECKSVLRLLQEDTRSEPGALAAFHHLFAAYQNWRRRWGLLRTELDEASFAELVHKHDVQMDVQRKLFFNIRRNPAPRGESTTAPQTPQAAPADREEESASQDLLRNDLPTQDSVLEMNPNPMQEPLRKGEAVNPKSKTASLNPLHCENASPEQQTRDRSITANLTQPARDRKHDSESIRWARIPLTVDELCEFLLTEHGPGLCIIEEKRVP